jgi:hypothetical protein
MTDDEAREAAGGNTVHELMLLHMARVSRGQERLEDSFSKLRTEMGNNINALAASEKADATRLHVRIDEHENKFHRPKSAPRILGTGETCAHWLGVVASAGGAGLVIIVALYFLHKMFEAGFFKW